LGKGPRKWAEHAEHTCSDGGRGGAYEKPKNKKRLILYGKKIRLPEMDASMRKRGSQQAKYKVIRSSFQKEGRVGESVMERNFIRKVQLGTRKETGGKKKGKRKKNNVVSRSNVERKTSNGPGPCERRALGEKEAEKCYVGKRLLAERGAASSEKKHEPL